ncbi:MAG TPA: hypothetical protein VFW35_05470 [Sphingomicrobium sp.]|nr:hypothetical protein [Sphingomicrobium sp.]
MRIAAGRGGMWTDEAWSVVYAAQARDVLGVFTRINHDNNHHLNTLWLQAVGMQASPLLARAPAILAGTLTIPVAALLFLRRSAVGAVAAAGLFAISPIMVIYGSEARGYALMMLAALVMILLVAEAVEGRAGSVTRWIMALTAALGMLSQLTMAAPLVLLTLWVYLEKRSSVAVRGAMLETLALMGPALGAAAAAALFALVPAVVSPTGLQTGGYNPFTVRNYLLGLSKLDEWTVGWMFPAHWIAAVALLGTGAAILVRQPAMMASRARLYGILILGTPVVILVEHMGNAQFSRFYLCSAIAILLLGAEWTVRAVGGGAKNRALWAAACALFLASAFWHDRQFIELGRGHPERAIRLMADQAPQGAPVDVATYQFVAPMVVAARQADYPLALANGCAPAEFMIVARGPNSPDTLIRCGRAMRAIGWSEATDLSGDAWVLYRTQA